METLTIKIDFRGITPASGNKIDILPPGLNSAVITEFRHFTDKGEVLYVYMNTGGLNHRERFNLDNEYAKSLLMGLLVHVGVPAEKLEDKEPEIPFHNLTGRTVYFNYTPPMMDAEGKRIENSYCKYNFHSKERYENLKKYMSVSAGDIEVEAPTNGAGTVVAAAKKVEPEGEFDFLLK